MGLVPATCGWDLWLGLVAGTGPLAYADLYRNSNHHLVAKRLDIAIISSVLELEIRLLFMRFQWS